MTVLLPSVTQAYSELRPLLDLLERDLESHLKKRPAGWHAVTRVKTLESAGQKLQTGRAASLDAMEDLVGAMIVVPTVSDISVAEKFVDRFFSENYRRPVGGMTSKKSSSFEFDDLRLYGCLRPDDSLPPAPYQDRIFEIQIKTFLQHAWAVATHDLIYKYERVSWARSRVAFHVKALLEHAELSISAIDELEGSPVVGRIGRSEDAMQQLIQHFISNWDAEFLPTDLRRLAESVLELGKKVGLAGLEEVTAMFDRAKIHYDEFPFGWDPYVVLVDFASIERPDRLKALLRKVDKPVNGRAFFVVASDDILRRLGLTADQAPCAIV